MKKISQKNEKNIARRISKWRPSFSHAFEVDTELMAAEILKQKTVPEKLAKALAVLRDRPIKEASQNNQSSQQTNAYEAAKNGNTDYANQAAAIKEAEAQMATRRKAIENRAASLKSYVLGAMQQNGIQRIDCPLFAISIAKNPPSINVYDESQIPDDYRIAPPPPARVPDKKLIAQVIKAGKDVPGARLIQGVRLSIK